MTSAGQKVANIGPGEQRKRVVFGVVGLAAGTLIAALLVSMHAALVWRLPLILVFYAGALGLFQSRDKT
jgi:hypothetical protein